MYSRIYCITTRSISTSRSLNKTKNLYTSLEITPKATQAEIKDAYYKLSMMYHPDKNDSIEAADKFKAISEAYEVLRNVRLRKLYDKGLFLNRSVIVDQQDVNKFYNSKRNKPPPPTGRTPIYDFDEWSRNHYGATLARDLQRRERRRQEHADRMSNKNDVKNETVLLCVFVLVCFTGYVMYRLEPNYDEVGDQLVGKDR